ncbi:phosphoenolpyruvate--protein phosphotransferase [Oenococcus kitaharae]|uniref:phosphoenolpyruvate--protein phosphotransferase n=1 Tax=Oenococcus TaxID=46254 RepID=UPI0021E9A996|nr:phosphoenolpyruvate--protein phosphotransferase [Oenococcus kitaharae]MCV3297109.1 phosphoenolpyruvate--protein phosphotransferase [Oenococcus kitaharae]
MTETEKLSGIAASDGVGIAKSYLLVDPDLAFPYNQTITDVEAEQARLSRALDASKSDLEKIKNKAEETLGKEEAEVFEAHITMLSDPELVSAIKGQIHDKKINAESALKNVTDSYIATFEAMTDNAYMQERAADIRDIAKRVTSHLLGVELPNPALIDDDVIVVAHDLTPSDTAQLDPKFVKGIVTDLGGRTAHASIMARSLEIPAVVGTGNAIAEIANHVNLIVDGDAGQVLISPNEDEEVAYAKKVGEYFARKREQAQLRDERTASADGVHFDISANIGSPKDLDAVVANGAEGIGLFRTEFLFIDSDHLPTEDEQFESYKAALQALKGKPVTVRTMDIGGDKQLSYWKLPKEANPFLGYRAIRISLKQDNIFRTQLRALLRASVYGDLWIMFPMIATLQEFRAAKKIYEEERSKLIEAGTKISDHIKLGIMVEIPASAVLADKFAKEVDFFSIGTNDLIQYTMAADRGNDSVSYLYQPYNPSILRLIHNVIDAAHHEGKFVAMCGEMAGDPIAVPILAGLGLDEFSMSASSVLPTRSLIKHLKVSDLKTLAKTALDQDSNQQVIDLVKSSTK